MVGRAEHRRSHISSLFREVKAANRANYQLTENQHVDDSHGSSCGLEGISRPEFCLPVGENNKSSFCQVASRHLVGRSSSRLDQMPARCSGLRNFECWGSGGGDTAVLDQRQEQGDAPNPACRLIAFF